MGPVDAKCERCGKPILWEGGLPRVCATCTPLTPTERDELNKKGRANDQGSGSTSQ